MNCNLIMASHKESGETHAFTCGVIMDWFGVEYSYQKHPAEIGQIFSEDEFLRQYRILNSNDVEAVE